MSTDLTDLRQRVLAGEELTIEQYRAVLDAKRTAQHAAAANAVKKTPSKRKATKLLSLEEMDALLGKL